MLMKKRFLSMFALLLMAATGAWAQEETLLTTITATGTDSYSETTPGVVTVTHDNDYFWDEYGWLWYFHAGSITVEAKEGYTITKCVFRQADKSTTVTISTAPFKVNFVEIRPYEEDPDYVKYLCEGTDPDENIDGISTIEVYGPAPATATTYSVTLAEGTEDFDKWTISPTEAAEGETVTVTYSGEKKVKSVKAVKKAPAPGPVTVTWNSPNFNSNPYTQDGVTLTASNGKATSGSNFYDYGANTFTTTLGKFTKIEIVCTYGDIDGWTKETAGQYQPYPDFDPDEWKDLYKLTWTGDAESVTIQKDVYGIQSITFTIQ
jgi:hypothetical protein